MGSITVSLPLLPVLDPGDSSFGFSKQDVRLGKQIPAFNENNERCQQGSRRQHSRITAGSGQGMTAGWAWVTEAVGGEMAREKGKARQRRWRAGEGEEGKKVGREEEEEGGIKKEEREREKGERGREMKGRGE